MKVSELAVNNVVRIVEWTDYGYMIHVAVVTEVSSAEAFGSFARLQYLDANGEVRDYGMIAGGEWDERRGKMIQLLALDATDIAYLHDMIERDEETTKATMQREWRATVDAEAAAQNRINEATLAQFDKLYPDNQIYAIAVAGEVLYIVETGQPGVYAVVAKLICDDAACGANRKNALWSAHVTYYGIPAPGMNRNIVGLTLYVDAPKEAAAKRIAKIAAAERIALSH